MNRGQQVGHRWHRTRPPLAAVGDRRYDGARWRPAPRRPRRVSAGSSSSAAPSPRCGCARPCSWRSSSAHSRKQSLPLSYTHALKPKPRIKLAANLPVGIELRGEVLEAYFDELVPIDRIQAAAERFPEGIEIGTRRRSGTASRPPPRSCAAPSTRSRSAGGTSRSPSTRCAAPSYACWPRRSSPASGGAARASGGPTPGPRDLRPFIEDVEVLDVEREGHTARLRTVLRLDASGAGRPEDVVQRAGPAARARSRRSGPASSSLTLPRSPGRLRRSRGMSTGPFWCAPCAVNAPRHSSIRSLENAMYAVVSSGGKQYRVEAGSTVLVERLPAEPGASVTVRSRAAHRRWRDVTVGTPVVAGATVSGTVLGEELGPEARDLQVQAEGQVPPPDRASAAPAARPHRRDQRRMARSKSRAKAKAEAEPTEATRPRRRPSRPSRATSRGADRQAARRTTAATAEGGRIGQARRRRSARAADGRRRRRKRRPDAPTRHADEAKE